MLAGGPAAAGGYSGSAHGDATGGVNRASTAALGYAVGNCAHCHEMHASMKGMEPDPAGGGPSVLALFAAEEAVCYYCHGTTSHNTPPLSRDVEAQFAKTYRHPVERAGRHLVSTLEHGADLDAANRHAECADCHNPHTIGKPGTAYHQYNSAAPADNNLVSNLLLGAWGVEPTWPGAAWTVPTTFTELRPTPAAPAAGVQKEYQLCLKCHSYYAFGSAENTGTGVTSVSNVSGEYVLTDQALEFAPGNKSGHPVVVTLNNRTASDAPRALVASKNGPRLKAPWSAAVGDQTMWCSDCHGDDAAAAPEGPHGSNTRYMLAEGYTWPVRPDTGKFWTLGDVKNDQGSWPTRLLCAKCHPIKNNGKFLNQVHDKGDHQDKYTFGTIQYQGAPCVSCHVAVPHGSKRGRLIAYSSDPDPYAAFQADGTKMPTLLGFRKSSNPDQYDKKNCYSTVKACDDHKDYNPPYDP
ncbi:hypothetical protein HCU62_07100 [Dissulfurirhabdus thermomarina]|uniref:hypothetical protein n=1 Tax=Dissulfurirhabdus thermomarina TaxID=1765737 RepID=UPI0014708491|nr:hypothetical protein [Dissulfurirhabdus thermomarina]NMX23701.1 hypothetical protein [Dissulfurirhabdus thermomarina]